MTTPAKNTICLWYDGDAEEAACFAPNLNSVEQIETQHWYYYDSIICIFYEG